MDLILESCRKSPLFAGLDGETVAQLIQLLCPQRRTYTGGSLLFSAGERAERLGILLSGRIYTVYEDPLGGRAIISSVEQGQLFCDAYGCSREQRMPVNILARTDCAVLLMEVRRLLAAAAENERLSGNLIQILAEKYMALGQKVMHLSGGTTRRKLLSYLSEQARLAKGVPFSVPFNRQELAEYLFVDRSGLSTEWNRLKREKVLLPEGNRYVLRISAPEENAGEDY